MGIARVNEIALTNACFTLQALTLKFNEELGLRSSNGVANNDMSICRMGNKTHISFPRRRRQNVINQTSRELKRKMLDQGQQMET